MKLEERKGLRRDLCEVLTKQDCSRIFLRGPAKGGAKQNKSMIKPTRKFRIFEKHFLSKGKISYPKALRIFDALYQEALRLKAFPLGKFSLGDLKGVIRLAKFINTDAPHG